MSQLDVAGLVSTQELLAEGWDTKSISRAARRGELLRVTRGWYLRGGSVADPEALHRLRAVASLADAPSGTVLSHASAAVLHGLPVPRATLSRVHHTRPARLGGSTTSSLVVHRSPMVEDHAVVLDGVRVTSVERTLVDLARAGELGWSVAAMDHALNAGWTTGAAVLSAIEEVGRMPGIRTAHRMAALANPLAESVGESLSRVAFLEAGLPVPRLQVAFHDAAGFVGRTDFYWPDEGVIGEFDGRVKYRVPRDGDPSAAVWGEKRREDRLRGLGHLVVRWVWDEVHPRPARAIARVREALVRGASARRRAA